MLDATQIAQILSGAALQIVVVLVSILMFIYVKMGSGTKGRYLTHFAISWGIMGFMYLISAITKLDLGGNFQSISKEIWNMVDSILSLINSGYLIIAWYMMRDYRLEQELGVENPLPTMSKPFISTVFASGASIIALFIALIGNIVEKKHVLFSFKVLDVFIAAVAIILVGIELIRIRFIREPEEGSFFFSEKWRHIFKGITFILYFAWGILQLLHLFSQKENPSDFFRYPDGDYYQWLAILKLLCATTAVILIIHSLPSVKWKHKATKTLQK